MRMGTQYRESLKHEAHEHVRFQEAQMSEKIQAYQRVIDANHRQSLSSKEQEILELKRQAEEERRIQNDRITQLEQAVQAQMQQNFKLKSMLDSQFAQACPSQIVETAAMTTTAEIFTSSQPGFEFVQPTSKAVPAAPPPKVNFPPTPKAPIAFSPQNVETLEVDGIEIVYHDPKYRVPIHVKKESDVARSSNNERPPEGVATSKRSGNPFTGKVGSPAPTQHYSPTELGPDDVDYFEPGDHYVPDEQDPGDGGSDDGGDGGGGPPTPPDPNNKPDGDKSNKLPRKNKVLAGIVQAPDESVLETLFYKQVKNCKAIQHDMNEYHRADEGTEKRTYSFLVSAVRRHLDRERLEANRDRVAKGLSGASRPSAPAVEGKTGFIPKGYCVAWNKGGCSKDNCTYKHEAPKPRDRSRKPSKTIEVALLIVRDLPSQRGKARKFVSRVDVIEELIASFFTRVRLVSLDKPLLPDRQVATAKVKGSLARTRRRRDHVALVALRAQRAQSPKDPASSSKPSPAAVCLVASMLASVSQAFCIPQPRVLCPSIRFNESPDVFLVKARGNLRPIGNQVTKDKVTFHEDISLKLISLP